MPGPAKSWGDNLVKAVNDGKVDEEVVGTDETCSVGQGVCTRTAFYRCDSDLQELVCDVTPVEGEDERCNTLDDDCDGIVDDYIVAE